MPRPDFGSSRRQHIADILRAYDNGDLTLSATIDAIELDVFEQPQQPSTDVAAAFVVVAVSTLLVGLDTRGPGDAVRTGQALADELELAGILRALRATS